MTKEERNGILTMCKYSQNNIKATCPRFDVGKLIDENEELEAERDALKQAINDIAPCNFCLYEDDCEHNNSCGCTTGEFKFNEVRLVERSENT